MAKLDGRGHERRDDPSRTQRDVGRDRPVQPRDGETRRFEQGVRDYLARHRGTNRAGQDQPDRGPSRPARPDSARSAESARFDAGARQYANRHRTGDRPGQPHQSDVDKTDRAIADRHARRPQYADERQAIWAKMREASEVFGDRSSGSGARLPDRPADTAERRDRVEASDRAVDRQPGDRGARSADQAVGPADTDRANTSGEAFDDVRTPEGQSARRPEITGMRLPDGFDDEKTHWLRRYQEKNADRVPEPEDLKKQPSHVNDAAAERARDAAADTPWLPPADRPPDTPHDKDELAEKNLERLTEMDPEKLSRLARARGELWRSAEDVSDAVREYTDLSYDIFDRPPTGKAEVRVSQPVADVPHHGLQAGTAAEGLFFLGFTIAEGAARVRTRLQERKEEQHGG